MLIYQVRRTKRLLSQSLDPIDGLPKLRDRFAEGIARGYILPEEINRNYLTVTHKMAPSSVNALIESAKAKAETLKGHAEVSGSPAVDDENPFKEGRGSEVLEKLSFLRAKRFVPASLVVGIVAVLALASTFGHPSPTEVFGSVAAIGLLVVVQLALVRNGLIVKPENQRGGE